MVMTLRDQAPLDPLVAMRMLGITRSFASTTGKSTVHAVGPIDLDLGAGEFVAIVGPSGCGKSTLLRLAAGLLRPTAGTIIHGGTASSSFVFQEPALLPWRSVERNCAIPLELTGVRQDLRRDRIRAALDLVGLVAWSSFYPHQLSGGMKMRVALARALVVDAEIMYLDEPFSAIDELTREGLNEHLSRLWLERRFAALFVTHNIGEAVFLAQRVIVMSERPGQLLGEVKVPFDYPRDLWLRTTAEFVHVEREVASLLRAHDTRNNASFELAVDTTTALGDDGFR